MIKIQKGTKDVLPLESHKWHYIESVIRELTALYGIREIRTPTFEVTELFVRGVGDTTDIVNKEMYTFLDKGGRSVTLKPEGTAGAARSYVENSLGNLPQPIKMYYLTPVFRYERPQSGRLREHHQFGVEYFGSPSPLADVEVITVAKALFDRLGIGNLRLNINSIGCSSCRKEYNKKLREYFRQNEAEYCPLCIDRMDKNPLRVLDCKEPKCVRLNSGAPSVLDYLCDSCRRHHDGVKSLLENLGIEYSVNPYIVRGLDYYTGTVFEFISDNIGAQGTVCGGGRYDNLVEDVGGQSTPAIGFGLGIERLIMVMEQCGLTFGAEEPPLVYVAPLGEEQYPEALKLVHSLRLNGISAETDYMARSLKAQMKYADKSGCRFAAVLGEDEIKNGRVMLKDMQNKENSGEAVLGALAEAVRERLAYAGTPPPRIKERKSYKYFYYK